MATRMRDAMSERLDELRYEPIEKRIRALVGDDAVVDSTRARARVGAAARGAVLRGADRGRPRRARARGGGGRPARRRPSCTPGSPSPRTRPAGESLSLRAGDATREAVAFAPADPDLAGHVILDFTGFDAWLEEDEPLVGHARDPYHRIDMRRSSREVRIELDGALLARSTRAVLLFETSPADALLPAARGRRGRARAPATGARSAPTRATRPTGRSTSARTSPGPTRTRCPRPRR